MFCLLAKYKSGWFENERFLTWSFKEAIHKKRHCQLYGCTTFVFLDREPKQQQPSHLLISFKKGFVPHHFRTSPSRGPVKRRFSFQ